jgi:hypothetical protein
MRNTLLHKLLKWIVTSSVSLLALPISVFIIIFSLYPDLVMDKTTTDFLKLKTYYDICDITKQQKTVINDSIHIHKLLSNPKTETNKKHLLIIDQTLSTVFNTINENEYTEVKKHLRNNLQDTIFKKDTTLSLKLLLFYHLLEKFDYSYNCDTLFVFFYYGNETNKNNRSVFFNEWVSLPLNKVDSIKRKIKNYEEYRRGKKLSQWTNFKTILDSVKTKISQEKIEFDCITFLSDFDHDICRDTVNEQHRKIRLANQDFKQLRDSTKHTKINLIALWKAEEIDKDKQESQKKFITNFDKYFAGVVHTEKIYIDDYKYEKYIGNGELLEFEEIITYKIPDKEKDNKGKDTIINLWATISNPLNYDEAKVKLKLDIAGKFYWKIKSISDSINTIVSFQKDCNNIDTKYSINQWYEEKVDSICLSLRLNPHCNFDDLKFCYCIQDSNGKLKFAEYDISIRKIFIEEKQKQILTKILDIFCIILCVSIISGFTLVILEFYDYYNDTRTTPKTISWIFGILILIAILGFVIYFVI